MSDRIQKAKETDRKWDSVLRSMLANPGIAEPCPFCRSAQLRYGWFAWRSHHNVATLCILCLKCRQECRGTISLPDDAPRQFHAEPSSVESVAMEASASNRDDVDWPSELDRQTIDDRCRAYHAILTRVFEWSDSAAVEFVATKRRLISESAISLGIEENDLPGGWLFEYVMPEDDHTRMIIDQHPLLICDFIHAIHWSPGENQNSERYDWSVAQSRTFELLKRYGIEPVRR